MRDAKEIAEEIVGQYRVYGADKFDALLSYDIEKAINDARAEAITLAIDEARSLLNWVHDVEQDASEIQLVQLINRIKNLASTASAPKQKN